MGLLSTICHLIYSNPLQTPVGMVQEGIFDAWCISFTLQSCCCRHHRNPLNFRLIIVFFLQVNRMTFQITWLRRLLHNTQPHLAPKSHPHQSVPRPPYHGMSKAAGWAGFLLVMVLHMYLQFVRPQYNV
jgi:hypothetical protein